jgi:glycosyltransferase involved in cell wall biosynthesis
MPHISIITVTLNAVDFIDHTIQSVLTQTYPSLEYIIIDGGSQDGTIDVIKNYESRLAYWHSRKDRGQSHAFNMGLAQARGDWIIFLNADDYLLNTAALEKMAPHLWAHHAADVVFGQVALLPRTGKLISGETPVIHGSPWCWYKFKYVCNIPHQAAFTSRQYFDRVGVFQEELCFSMDYEHYLRAGRNLHTVFVPQVVTAMREGGKSLSNIIPSLREWRNAQLRHKVASPLLLWSNFLARIFWFICRQRVNKLKGSSGTLYKEIT